MEGHPAGQGFKGGNTDVGEPQNSHFLPLSLSLLTPCCPSHTNTRKYNTPLLACLEQGMDLPRLPDPPRVPSGHAPTPCHRLDVLSLMFPRKVPHSAQEVPPTKSILYSLQLQYSGS